MPEFYGTRYTVCEDLITSNFVCIPDIINSSNKIRNIMYSAANIMKDNQTFCFEFMSNLCLSNMGIDPYIHEQNIYCYIVNIQTVMRFLNPYERTEMLKYMQEKINLLLSFNTL